MNVDCYTRSYSAHIMFVLRSNDDRARLRDLFLDLAHHRVTEVSLRQADWVEFATNCRSIVFRLVTSEASRQIQTETSDDRETFVWSRHEEGWMECAEKMDALRERSHQCMGNGDAEIEISFLEDLKQR